MKKLRERTTLFLYKNGYHDILLSFYIACIILKF